MKSFLGGDLFPLKQLLYHKQKESVKILDFSERKKGRRRKNEGLRGSVCECDYICDLFDGLMGDISENDLKKGHNK